MFKHCVLYQITDPTFTDLASVLQAVGVQQFKEGGPTDRMVAGWVPPARHAPDLFGAVSDGTVLLSLRIDTKTIPGDVVKQRAAARIADIEARELRRVGKKEAKEIREMMVEELLPQTFFRSKVTRALLDLQDGWLLVEASGHSRAELLTSHLRDTLGCLPTRLPNTGLDPTTAMTTWVEHGAPEGFTVDLDCVLTAPGEGGAQLTCRRHDLGADEIVQHVRNGKLVTQLALSHGDRQSFVLTDKLLLKRLHYLDQLVERQAEQEGDDAAAIFDSELLLLVEESRALRGALLEALGGVTQ